MPTPDIPDLAGAAEHLRGWLDDLAAAVVDGPDGDGLGAWHQAHAPHLIAAALSLEELAAARPVPDEEETG